MEFIIYILPLCLGWILDKIWGDPAFLPHPIVGFGKLIAQGEKKLNRDSHRILKGGILTILLVLGAYIISYYLLIGLLIVGGGWLYVIVSSILVFYCLAGTTLMKEVKDVFKATDISLEKGRQQVARIVGRDTNQLSAQEVRTAALETLAENLSDGVIAPLFWYLLLGVPGMLSYKMINTLDSMIGYRNERYLLFGKVAARLDDVANYIPARVTAGLMIIVNGKLSLFHFVMRYGSQHASPNSGFPEAALAGILNCRFGGPHNYFGQMVWKPYIGETERSLTTTDMKKALQINLYAELMMMAIILGIMFISCTV